MYAASSSIVKGTILAYNYVVNNVKSTTTASNTKPIVVNGKTYLPLDMIKEGTKVNVSVNTKTKTVAFGEKNAKVPFENLITKYGQFQTTKSSAYAKIGDKSFDSVLAGEYKGYRDIYLNPNGGYQTLHLDVATLQRVGETESQEGTASAYTVINEDTNKEIFSFSAKVGEGIQSYDINVAGVKKIKIQSYVLTFSQPTDVILPTSHFK